ncbi:hypothetical protein D3C84_589900 [compost metagenome]
MGHIDEALGRLAEKVFLGEPDVVEKQFSRVLTMQTHLLQFQPALESRHAALDDKQPDAMPVIRIGTRRDYHHIGQNPIGDVSLGAIEQPVVALILGTGLDAGQIAASIGLGHRDSQDAFATDRSWQVLTLLFLVGELIKIRSDHHGVQVLVERCVAMTDILFLKNLLVTQVPQAAAAILLVSPHQQKTLLADLLISLTIDIALLAPTFGMRANLFLHEASY